MKRKIFFVVLLQFSFCFALNFAEVYHNYLGKSAYQKGEFSAASEDFLKMTAGKKEKNGVFNFNLGDSYYKNQDYDNALAQYNIALLDKDFEARSFAYQNIGNSYFKKGEFEKAKNSYIQAIKEDPGNYQARLNLEIAEKMKQKQQKQPQQSGDDQNKQDQEGKKKDSKDDQDQKREDKKDQQQQKKGEDQKNSDQQKEQDKRSSEQKKQKNQDKSEQKQDLTNQDKQKDPQKKKAEKREAIKKKMADKKIDKILNKEKMLRIKLSNQKGEVPANGKYW